MRRIEQFQGEYRWLSNFWIAPFVCVGSVPKGTLYQSVEHFYQSRKSFDVGYRQKVAAAHTPGKAKRLGRKCEVREDWDEVKLGIMRQGVYLKFAQNNELATKLLETGDAELVEGNYWGDTFWGVDLRTGEGENHMGRILQEVRSLLRKVI